MPRDRKMIAGNKKAYHDYFIDETFEAGIELSGTEVKSLRDRGANLRDSYASIKHGEIFVHGLHIAPYSHGNRANLDPIRVRRLLLHKKEIRYLAGKVAERGSTLVPTKLYFNADNRAKIEIGLARGKKLYDKRASIAERDQKRETERAMAERNRGG